MATATVINISVHRTHRTRRKHGKMPILTPKETFVRFRGPPDEGLLGRGQQGVDVGDQLQVKLISTDPRRGYLDFAR